MTECSASPKLCGCCNSPMSDLECQTMDDELDHLNPEDREFLFDQLPSKYQHESSRGDPVLNLCKNCCRIAFSNNYKRV